ncbi:MAG TPA: WG repeat-containing protein, partial [Saprospiraceae bacterium]|nr:WG repeat-containing protein [Saprospiraceae bacterium]
MKKAIILWCLVLTGSLSAQQAFPVKVNKKWGLIDAAGQVILPPVYEAIGEFRHFGHATMQRNGKVGLLDEQGKEVIRPVYEDL